MSDTKDMRLWQAATDGDLDTVVTLTMDPAVDVNWGDDQRSRTPFYRACGHGRTAVVRHLIRHERIDVNKPSGEASPFLVACQEGHQDIVAMLLADRRVDVRKPPSDGASGFFVACQNGHVEVVTLLLTDPRTDVNAPRTDNSSPLWFATQNGHLDIVRLLLSVSPEVDTGRRSKFNQKTAAEQGRMQPRVVKSLDETDDDVKRRATNGPAIAILLDEYDRNPAILRESLRRLEGIRGLWSL